MLSISKPDCCCLPVKFQKKNSLRDFPVVLQKSFVMNPFPKLYEPEGVLIDEVIGLKYGHELLSKIEVSGLFKKL